MNDNAGDTIRLKSVPGILAIGMLVLVAGTTVAVFAVDIPANNQTIVGQLIGTELTLLGMAIAYFYGSSSTSRKKDETISTMAQTTSTAQNTLSSNIPGGTANTMTLKPGELAVAVGTQGGGAEITKSPEVLDTVLENLARDSHATLDRVPHEK